MPAHNITRIALGNPCGTTGTHHCFDCQACPNTPSDEAFVVVRRLDSLRSESITGPEAEHLMRTHGLTPWGKQLADVSDPPESIACGYSL